MFFFLKGVPLVMSCPHYLFAPQEIVDDVVGIKPNLTQHQTLIYIEPLTGIPMKAHKRLQFNTQLFKDARIRFAFVFKFYDIDAVAFKVDVFSNFKA
jgi:hypothetical protein